MSEINPALEGVAIIGMAGRFPGAPNVRAFWQKLTAGEETISTLPGGIPDGSGSYIPRRGLLEKPEWFDAAFFGISPREAEVMDPQQRVFLEECWASLEDAGCDPARYTGAVGVFAGMSNNTYWAHNVAHHPELTASVGWLTAMMANEKDYLATRVAYKLNLRGPALSVYTACSTSLVAVCQAVQSLLSYACDVALAGGISITFPHERGYHYDEGGILSPDGHCRAFDAGAAGTVFSNGAGVVTLKRLADAVADGDQIYAAIKGAALNNDGSNKVSFTAPSVEGHAEVIALAHALAGFEPRSIGYVEAHGTGTPLGDPIEIAGLTQAFRAGTDERNFCALGSVKTNIGHLDAAAGVAGLIKAALVLKHRRIPASLHFTEPNPALELETSPFFVAAQPQDWPATDGLRRAGVSSFGVGGTNAHVVLEEAPARAAHDEIAPGRPQLLVLSAKTESALARRASDLADSLEASPEIALRDAAITLQMGRAEFTHRRAFVCSNREVAISALRGFEPRRTLTGKAGANGVVFMFPGQGAQYPAMGAQLYHQESAFREAFDECAEVLRGQLDLRSVIGAGVGGSPATGAELRETRVTQPAIFAVSYALARLWMSVGVTPTACIGHSVGEYVAAVLAGVFSLSDGLSLVAARACLVQEQPAGSMLAARMSESEAMQFLNDRIALAAVNSPRLVVLAGPDEEIAQVEAQLLAGSIACKRLETSHAFHSPMMDSVVAPLAELVTRAERQAPQIPILSTVTKSWLTEMEATDPNYWARHARETVRFSPAIADLVEGEHQLFLECGPGQTLTQLARQHPASDRQVLTSIREGVEEWTSFYSALGQLWTRGVGVDWSKLHAGAQPRRVSLPTYPFERKRFFADAPAPTVPEVLPVPPEDGAAEVEPPAPVLAEPATTVTATRQEVILQRVLEELQRLSGFDLSGVQPAASFVELGFDSLFLTQVAVAVQKRFGVKITFRQLLQDVTSPAALAAQIDSALPAEAQFLAGETAAPAPAATPAPRAHGPFRGIDASTSGELDSAQREHLDQLIARYNERTGGSKRYTAEHRGHLADPRAIAGFRREWKEIIYPLVCDRSEGAKVWDLDGNEYVDVTLGFGQILFGHRPPFLLDAVEKQLHRGFEIGPTSPLAGQLAERLCRFLQLDRVAFCNTGSEAVAAALRLARTVTGRDKVAVFGGGYHGIFDEVLFRAGPTPIAPGIPQSAVENLVVLEYGTDEALAWLRENTHTLAAVLIEPVQSRNPALLPREFLHEIRRLTQEQGAALIFDEIVTGFRVAPRGAQEHFDIRADLATYGKVIGGGLPIGIIAGTRQFMDALDGGAWQYGDDSFPEIGVTFFAGTFVRHPLALAAASAILEKLESAGPSLQEELARKAADLAASMNAHLEARGVPCRWQQFSSLYHLPLPPELRYAPLIFAHMRLRGIHVWENRPCFLSAAHSEADIAQVASAFRDSVDALVAAGLLPGSIDRNLTIPWPEPANRAELVPVEESPAPELDIVVEEPCPIETDAAVAEPAPVELPAAEVISLPEQEVAVVAELPLPAADSSPQIADAAAPPPASSIHSPVSDAQREILLAAQLGDDANCAFNDGIALRIRSSLDPAIVESALSRVVARHEALRISFAPDLNEQIVHPAVGVALEVIDLSESTASAQADALSAAAKRDALTPFNLQAAPLWRAKLFKLGADEHEFRFTAHHAICDGWSFSIVAGELAALYTATARDTEAELPDPLPLRTHIEEQQTADALADFARAEDWWLRQYASPPPLLNLPLDGARASKRTFEAATVSAAISRESSEQMRKAAAASKSTSFALLIGAFAVLLRRLSGQSDLVVGIASAAQASAAAPLVGHCVSFLPLRIKVADDPSFAAVVASTSELIMDARENSAVTFGRLLQKLDVPREAGRMPLTALSFNVDRSPAALDFAGARADYQPLPKHRYHLELSFNLVENDGGYSIFCHFNRSLFKAETIERWLSHYLTLVESAVASPETAIAELPILDAAQTAQILFEWNDTTTDYPREEGIDTLFEAVATAHPDAIAITDGRKSLTYAALNLQANGLAAELLASGVQPGALIGVCAERSAELIIACIAVVKAGCAYVPLDPSWPAERLNTLAGDANLATVLTRLEHARHFSGKIMLLDGPKPAEASASSDPRIPTGGSTPAYVIYTSGSTGAPKGVMVPHRAISRLVLNTDYAQLTSDDTVGHASNPAFDAATWEIWGPLLNGAHIVVLPKSIMLNAAALKQTLEEQRVTALFLTTALFNQLANTLPATFQSLHHLLVGGDVANAAVMARVLREAPPRRLLNIYGPTEATTFACAHHVAEPPADTATIPIGRPIANTQAYILDERRQPVPIGVPGELYLGGDGVASGYHRHEDLTAERFVVNPFSPEERLYRTGDRARWREDGAIEFLGRIDGQIKLRGFRVELGEIELELSRHPGVRESAVKVLGNTPEDKSLAAYFVPRNGNPPAPDELRVFLHRRLPDYMIPRAFVALPALPLTPNGKVDRAALPLPNPAAVLRPPARLTVMEQKVADLMAATLGQPNVSASDDFFQLGGHSLLAMDFMARLRKVFGVEIPPSVLFETPNVPGLARYITEHQPKSVERSDFRFLVPVQRGAPDRQPLFLIAGGWGGEIEFLVYAQIGRLLDPEQPIWGLKARGAGTAEPPHRAVSEMAADYLAEIRALQPCGPYWIAGECVGGICAHEIACQLRDAGEEVAGLILLDTSVPNPDELADYLAEEERKRASEVQPLTLGQRIRQHWKQMASLSIAGKVSYILKKVTGRPTAIGGATGTPHPRGQSEYPPTLMRHRLRPYPGRVTLLVDDESFALHGQLGWERAAIGGLDLHVLPGDHISYIREQGTHAAQKLHEILAESIHRP